MMLVANTCFAELILASDIFCMAIFALQNDCQQIQYQDRFRIFRGYLMYSASALQNYSYLLQAIYRYIAVVYPARLFWQSRRTQILLIILSWVISFGFALTYIFMNEISYDMDNQACPVHLGFSFCVVFAGFFIYIIPIWLIRFIYLFLVRYVKGMNQRIIPANTLSRVQRELRMVRRIVVFGMILFIIGFSYGIFVFISFFTTPPKYYFRITLIFIYVPMVGVMIALFQFTDTLKSSVKKIINFRPKNTIIPALA